MRRGAVTRPVQAVLKEPAHPFDHALNPRRVELLAQLERLIFARGYRALTMDMIAQELRCSKRALYELAPNRKMLFLLVIERWAKRTQALGDVAALQQSDPKVSLAAYLSPGISESQGMTDVFLQDLREHPLARAALEEHQKIRMARLCDIVENGIGLGVFGKVHAKLMAGICLASIEQINDPAFLNAIGLSFSEAFAELYRVLLNGLSRSADD